MSCDMVMPKHSDLFIGKSLTKTKTYTEEAVVEFAKISLDFNPLHFVEQTARLTRFGGRIIHGLLIAESLFSGVLSELTPWCVYLRQETDFRLPVRIGDKIKATGTIIEIKENGIIKVALFAVNQNDDMVIRGTAIMKKLDEMYQSDDAPKYPVLHTEPI